MKLSQTLFLLCACVLLLRALWQGDAWGAVIGVLFLAGTMVGIVENCDDDHYTLPPGDM